jgi:hypothetical protein
MKMRSALSMPGDWLVSLCLFLTLACAPMAVSADAALGTPVVVNHHVPTDVFNLLDNLSDWMPGYTTASYGTYWKQHFGISRADRAALEKYAEFRRRVFPVGSERKADDPESPDGLFASAQTRTLEPFAAHFFLARTFDEGVATAIAGQDRDDQAMLRAYFDRFAVRAKLIVAGHSRFKRSIETMGRELRNPLVAGLASQIRAFYGVEDVPPFDARFVWWPDSESTQAKVRGPYMLLYSSPDSDQVGASMDWAPIVLHEYSHFVSAGQSAARKRSLTSAYLRGCSKAADLRNPLNALEEPLAIYWGQYRFEHAVRAKELATADSWYVQPVADAIAKALAKSFPSAAPAPTLDSPQLIAVAAEACRLVAK